MRILHILFISLCLFILSCEAGDIFDFDFSQPEVSSSSPSNHESNVAETAVVTVTFSKSMDTMKTANAFSLASESGRMKGYFTWEGEGRVMTFHPSKNLVRGEIYTITISIDAEDKKGNDLRAAYTAVFYAGGDTRPPTLVTASPDNDALVPVQNVNVVLEFSEPLDLDSLYDGITISPPVQGRFSPEMSGSHQVITFDPTYPLSWGTTYTVTVGSQLKDVNGNAFQGTHQFRFTIGNDFTAPAINSVTQAAPFNGPDGAETEGINCIDDIVITFSEEVDESSLFGAITISSPADYYIVRDTVDHRVARVKLREPLESENHYTLKISKGVIDLQGNALDREYSFAFFTNHPDALCPVVSSVLDENGDPLIPDDINTLSLALGSSIYPKITVRFNKEMNPHSIKISLKHVMGVGGSQPSLVNPQWTNSFKDYSFTLEKVRIENVYSITIEGGEGNTRDSLGNCLKEDSVWYVTLLSL